MSGIKKPRARGSSSSGRTKAAGKKGIAEKEAAPTGWIMAALAVIHLPPILMVLSNAPYLPWRQLVPIGVLIAATPIVDLVLRRIGFKGDPALVFSVVLLLGFGLALQFRFRGFSAEGLLQAWIVPLGALGVLFAALLAARAASGRAFLRNSWGLAYLGAIGLMLIVLFFGKRYRGALFLPGGVNPVEGAKPLLCLAMAGFLAGHADAAGKKATSPVHFLVTLGVLWGPVCGLLVIQRDLGMLFLLNFMLLVMLGKVFGRWGWSMAGGVCAVGMGAFFLPRIPHVMVRITAWLRPFDDPTGKGWQVLQSLSAMYAGGMWGKGLGGGHPQAVPIFSSDFIYAAVAEEMGFAGCLVLISVYVLFLGRAWAVVGRGRNSFDSALAAGAAAILCAQTVMNIGGVVKALPMTGVPLPFVSQGGSSLFALSLLAGWLAGLSDSGRAGARTRKK